MSGVRVPLGPQSEMRLCQSSVRGMRFAPGAGCASVGRKSSLCTGASKCAICAPLLTPSLPETACVEGWVSAEPLARASSAKVAVRARFESAWMSVRYRRRWFSPRQRMVGIAQSVERSVVVREAAGSSPVTHPKRRQPLASSERPIHAREATGSTPRLLVSR